MSLICTIFLKPNTYKFLNYSHHEKTRDNLGNN